MYFVTLSNNMMLGTFVHNKLLLSLHKIERAKKVTVTVSVKLSGVIGSDLCQDSIKGSLNVHSI